MVMGLGIGGTKAKAKNGGEITAEESESGLSSKNCRLRRPWSTFFSCLQNGFPYSIVRTAIFLALNPMHYYVSPLLLHEMPYNPARQRQQLLDNPFRIPCGVTEQIKVLGGPIDSSHDGSYRFSVATAVPTSLIAVCDHLLPSKVRLMNSAMPLSPPAHLRPRTRCAGMVMPQIMSNTDRYFGLQSAP